MAYALKLSKTLRGICAHLAYIRSPEGRADWAAGERLRDLRVTRMHFYPVAHERLVLGRRSEDEAHAWAIKAEMAWQAGREDLRTEAMRRVKSCYEQSLEHFELYERLEVDLDGIRADEKRMEEAIQAKRSRRDSA